MFCLIYSKLALFLILKSLNKSQRLRPFKNIFIVNPSFLKRNQQICICLSSTSSKTVNLSWPSNLGKPNAKLCHNDLVSCKIIIYLPIAQFDVSKPTEIAANVYNVRNFISQLFKSYFIHVYNIRLFVKRYRHRFLWLKVYHNFPNN
jgi:hypothetical protein